MQITLQNTDQIVHINGVPTRVWIGTTEHGITIHCFITRIAVPNTEDCSAFEKELQETAPLKANEVWPLRMLL